MHWFGVTANKTTEFMMEKTKLSHEIKKKKASSGIYNGGS